MAPDGPLLLHGCRFRSLQFQYTPENLYCLQAHLETLWEAAAIKAARLLNNLEYLAGMRVSTKDVDAFAAFKRRLKGSSAEHYSVRDHGEAGRRRGEELRQEEQQERQQLLEQQQQQQQQQQRREDRLAARATDSEGSGEGVSTTEGVSRGENGDAKPDVGVAANTGDEELTWREALARMRQMGLGPGQVLGRKGHMPMARRQQGLHYNELVQGLGGKKRERLDRHLALKTAGTESGQTNAFYVAMQLQGAKGVKSLVAAAAAPEESTAPH